MRRPPARHSQQGRCRRVLPAPQAGPQPRARLPQARIPRAQ